MPQTHQQLRDSQVHIPTPNAENHFRMALFLRRSFSPKIPTSLLITQAQCNKAQLKIIYLFYTERWQNDEQFVFLFPFQFLPFPGPINPKRRKICPQKSSGKI